MRVNISRLPRIHLAVYASYLALTLLITWPLVTVFSSRLIGHPFGDSYEYVGTIWWLKHALQTGAPLFYQPLLAYPDGLSALLLLTLTLQNLPPAILALAMPLSSAYNLWMLLTLALNGWAMFYLVSHLTKNRWAAWLAGVVFMAYPTIQGQLAAGHLGLLELWGVPLYAWALLRLRETHTRRYILLAAIFFVVSLLGNTLLLIYALFPLTAFFALTILFKREWAALWRVILAAMIGAAAYLLLISPALLDSSSGFSQLQERGDITFSADLLAIVSPSFQHPLFSGLDYPHKVLGIDPFEKMAYIGIVAGLMVLIALWRSRESRWWFGLAFIAWVFSLGPVLKVLDSPVHLTIEGFDTLIALPWLAAGKIPGLSISRTPARFDFTLAFAVAVLVGYGASELYKLSVFSRLSHPLSGAKPPFGTQRGGGRGVGIWKSLSSALSTQHSALLSLFLAGLILYEYPFFWKNGLPDMPTIPGIVPAPIAALGQRTDIRAVFDIPWDHLLTDKEALFLQTGNQLPLIAGHIVRRTPVEPAKLTLMQATLDPALLNAAGADIVILHKNWDDDAGKLDAFTRAHLGNPIYEDENYAVFNAPETDAQPVFRTLISPDGTFTEPISSYLYTPAPGWTHFTGKLNAAGRDVTFSLNDLPVQKWHIEGETAVDAPLYLPQAGYYAFTLALDPPCPVSDDPALTCRSASASAFVLADPLPPDMGMSVDFANGLTLIASKLIDNRDSLTVWLNWRFDKPRSASDVRFVHVIDAQGNLVAQSDDPIGVHPGKSGWAESVNIPLPKNLLSGKYSVILGWYAYPDTTPFPIVPGAASGGLLEVGRFTR